MDRQARLLLPEPLAVNKGERVVGTIHFKVCPLPQMASMLMIQANESRSYDITIDLGVDRPGTQVQPNPLLRKGEYNLSQQCFK
jgi:histone-arginine methyltransferase CARM1